MISKETFDKIQEYKEIGFSVLRVSKKLGISYNTAYNWWNKTEADFNAKQREHEPVLDNYRQFVIELLKICPQMNNTLILKRVRESFPEFDVPDASFFRYVKKLRNQTGLQKPKRRGAIRDEVQPGYEGQVDFGQYVMKNMYGVNTRIYFFCMVLSYSRMKFAYFSFKIFHYSEGVELRIFLAASIFEPKNGLSHCIIIHEKGKTTSEFMPGLNACLTILLFAHDKGAPAFNASRLLHQDKLL